ncbi:transposase [Rhizobium sp. 3T7]|uniref:transposase n=1 Tax=Rhizobium sp. 3T7 TaxID=2874922 RepID=UPI001CCBC4F6|nr:transposase [Rhizobium sp. 3T7]MBZ9792654.1 transposase [Rhizobium sp. 3T7]
MHCRPSASLIPFVVGNTPGSHLRTDEDSTYRAAPDRRIPQVNLSRTPIPAHISFKWIHIVFANLKRWALGTFHGFRVCFGVQF